VIVNNQICLHCGACVGSCPTNSIFLHETSTIEFLPTCTECELCVVVCPVGAICGMSGRSVAAAAPGVSSVLEVRQ
jgi:ferredoxin